MISDRLALSVAGDRVHPLPTTGTGWLALLFAATNLLANGALLSLIAVHKPGVLAKVWADLVVGHLPAVLLVAAAGLCCRGRSPARFAVAAAGLLATVGAVCALDPWAGGLVAAVVGEPAVRAAYRWLSLTPGSYLIALTALVSAVIAWRQQDQLVSDGDAS